MTDDVAGLVEPANKDERCTCMEVNGEDPNCVFHGLHTAYALKHNFPEDWQSLAVEYRDMQRQAAQTIATLQAQLQDARGERAAVTAWLRKTGETDWNFSQTECELLADAIERGQHRGDA
jgi:hypothetical protein